MIIEISKLSEDGAYFSGEEGAEVLNVEEEPDIKAKSPVSYELFVQLVSHQLVVKGKISTTVEVECSRCTHFFSTMLEDSSFLRAYELPEGTETIDLTEDLREAVLLQLPGFPVCGSECKGLCPICGQDLNKSNCACKPQELVGRWNVLDGLEIQEKGPDSK